MYVIYRCPPCLSYICVIRLFLFLDNRPHFRQGKGPCSSPWRFFMCPVRVSRRVKLLWQTSQANLFPITSTDPAPRYREYLLGRTEDDWSEKIIKRKNSSYRNTLSRLRVSIRNNIWQTLFKITVNYERQCMKKICFVVSYGVHTVKTLLRLQICKHSLPPMCSEKLILNIFYNVVIFLTD
jgi:hypothetical protein